MTPAAFPGTSFHLLPDELLERAFSFLPLYDVFVFRLVCKRWNSLLRSHHFLASFDLRNSKLEKKWITCFNGSRFAGKRSLLLYDPSSRKRRCLSLSFLPSKFNFTIAAAGGLFCVASYLTEDGQNVMCVCNPFTKTFKQLPYLQLDLVEARAIMEQKNNNGSYKVYVMSSCLMAIYDSGSGYWLNMNMNVGENMRQPRSPVICDGAIYALMHEGSLWSQGWNVVVYTPSSLTDADEGLDEGPHAGFGHWVVLTRSNSGEFPELIRRPRLLGANGCLLLIGNMNKSVLSYIYSTFVIFKFDFIARHWVEIASMPEDLYSELLDRTLVKIFGNIQDVYFFCQSTHKTVACKLRNRQVLWHKVVDCRDWDYSISNLCPGFTFDLKLGSVVQS